MAASVTVNLRAIRERLAKEIATLEKAVEVGNTIVADDKSSRRSFAGTARNKQVLEKKLKKNLVTLSKAKRMLKQLRRQEQLFAEECCDQQIQNCELLYL